jgi:hypothetical protein
MERTRTKGIFTDADGTKVVDKIYKGRRIKCRLGKLSQAEAEAWLSKEIVQVRQAVLFGESPPSNCVRGATAGWPSSLSTEA